MLERAAVLEFALNEAMRCSLAAGLNEVRRCSSLSRIPPAQIAQQQKNQYIDTNHRVLD